VIDKTITKLPPQKMRECPNCGYLVAQFMLEASRYDYDCPRCGKHKLSEFKQSDVPI
jgi:uncharacterized paraquat-inducible protein A